MEPTPTPDPDPNDPAIPVVPVPIPTFDTWLAHVRDEIGDHTTTSDMAEDPW